ncbi:MAG: hypothetical protein J0H79_07410 [Alphaproteobacteria bacterium]|nr:hypothetical protein [Alphaproteobacteria bacterium]OJU56981.1 MAG: hypothetical protein BGO00_07435 [Alphaproteobacteria bacterium 62-8]
MASAEDTYAALADAIGKRPKAVEAYGLRLRSNGWLVRGKRGRGSLPIDNAQAAKLLLALLSGGPSELDEFMPTYATACVMPAASDEPVVRMMRVILGLSDNARFLDFITALVWLFRDGSTDQLIYHAPFEDGQVDDWVYDGPNIDIRVHGPFPVATIKFHLASPLIEKLVAMGCDHEQLLGEQMIVFLHEIYGHHADAMKQRKSTRKYDKAIEKLREDSERGIGFERFIGGRQISAVAAALRDSDDKMVIAETRSDAP